MKRPLSGLPKVRYPTTLSRSNDRRLCRRLAAPASRDRGLEFGAIIQAVSRLRSACLGIVIARTDDADAVENERSARAGELPRVWAFLTVWSGDVTA